MRKADVWLRTAVAGLCLVLAGSPRAQYVVVEAIGVDSVTKGQLLAPGQAVVLPEQGMLRLIGRDLRAVLLRGPLQGPIGDLVGSAGAARIDATLLGRLGTLLTQPLRVRGPAEVGDDYAAIDLLLQGRQCVFGRTVRLRRPHALGTARVELALASGGRGASFGWEAEAAEAPWPHDVPLVDGARYEGSVTALGANGRLRWQPLAFTLILLDTDAADPAAALAALLDNDCRSQALRLVSSLAGTAP